MVSDLSERLQLPVLTPFLPPLPSVFPPTYHMNTSTSTSNYMYHVTLEEDFRESQNILSIIIKLMSYAIMWVLFQLLNMSWHCESIYLSIYIPGCPPLKRVAETRHTQTYDILYFFVCLLFYSFLFLFMIFNFY